MAMMFKTRSCVKTIVLPPRSVSVTPRENPARSYTADLAKSSLRPPQPPRGGRKLATGGLPRIPGEKRIFHPRRAGAKYAKKCDSELFGVLRAFAVEMNLTPGPARESWRGCGSQNLGAKTGVSQLSLVFL
jgi:hypothetical protein